MQKAFQSVIDANYANLYKFAVSLCRSQTDAWDLTQETFLIWAKKGNTIRSQGATKSWLYTTLYREFLKTVKRSNRHTSIEDQEFEYEGETACVDDIQKIDAYTAMEMLTELKIEYRNVISLYYLESYSYKEIAKILDIPIGTVMSRLARGKDILKRKFKKADTPNKIVDFSKTERSKRHG
ncbi:MAG: RNA polymerase sigma factor [Verrucomicrobiota bacterium]